MDSLAPATVTLGVTQGLASHLGYLEMALTEVEIRAAKAVDTPLKLFDGGGFFCSSIRMAVGGGGSSIATTGRSAASRWACIPTFR